ncbi:ThiF family adenylyltransferase [Flavobacterium sp.]|uniref:ThiF family adenylyltransferase n=1 Tax=Flavobacterium sp. TaxID=239 RepID=UPI00391BFB82
MQNKRYDKQIQLTEIGISGQEKLTKAKVLVIGAGGLGCPVLQNLAAAGVGCIGIVDGDVVEETNLHRQFLYTSNDIGEKKVAVAKAVISKQNPEVSIEVFTKHFTSQNAFEIVSDYQIIVDCTDDNATRYLINDITLVKNIPMVYASIHEFEGQLSVFNYQNGPTYRCLFPESEDFKKSVNCNDSGVLGVLPNLLGVMQANEVLKIILGIGEVLSGKLFLYNGLNNQMQTIHFSVNEVEKDKGIQNGLAVLQKILDIVVGVIASEDFFVEVTKEENLVIDIRETYEEPKLEFKNIIQVPLAQLDDFLKNINSNQKIILFCQEGNRSKLTGDYLIKNGFANVHHLSNGIASLLKKNI